MNPEIQRQLADIRSDLTAALEVVDQAQDRIAALAVALAKDFQENATLARDLDHRERVARDPEDKYKAWNTLRLVPLAKKEGREVRLRWVQSIPMGYVKDETNILSKSIRLDAHGNYNEKTLRAKAPKYLANYVVDAERSAREIRKLYQALRTLRLQIRSQIEPGWRLKSSSTEDSSD